MWRTLRVIVLLFILASVAQGAWLARSRAAKWDNTLWVVVYSINGDGSDTTARYIADLQDATFEPIVKFFKQEGRKYGVGLVQPIEVKGGPTLSSKPPAPPFGGSRFDVIVWSLKLRFWAYRNDRYEGPRPEVRIFVSYFDPARIPRLPHSTGLQKGLIGVVNAFARSDMDGSNNVVIAHELLHTLGATDKYDFVNNRPLFPDGFADPDASPLYPQSRAEIMAGRIPRSPQNAEIPADMDEVVIGARTAREINWVKAP